MSRTALLFLFLPTLIFGSYFELDHEFSRTIHPCQDFYKFVCNPDGNRNDSYMYTYGQKYIRVREILGAFKNYSDPISDFIREIYIRDHWNRTLFEKGRLVGMDLAMGKQKFEILYNVSAKALTIIDGKTMNLRNRSSLESVNCVYNECPGYVKGILFEFKNATDDDDQMDLQKLNITAMYIKVEPEELTEEEKDDINIRVFETHDKPWATPYLNLLTAKFSSERGLWLSDDKDLLFKKFAKALIDETVAELEEQAWIPSGIKQRVIESVKTIRMNLPVPDSVKNLDNVNEAIAFYLRRFEQYGHDLFKETLFEDELYKRMLKDESCNTVCQLKKFKEFAHLTMRKCQHKYGATDKYVDIIQAGTMPVHLFDRGAFSVFDEMMIYPSYMLYANDDLPIGFRYGHIVHILAHEIFHTLDANLGIDARMKKAANELIGLKEYDEAIKCYEDYYGSFGATAPNGTVFFPDGKLKKNEGFADVEGTRIALRVLQKTLFSSRAFKSSYSYSAYNDFEWFFMGAMMLGCPKAGLDDFEEFKRTEMGVHPRLTIRVNAWVRQLDEFSKIFNCKPGDPMYVVDKQCKAFP
ncbi:hypothetical protein QR680_011221 [Steinernema hermaphroditum]|uniref:Peptidase M13 C-terminal domain-containing protein n=1 Tax=Steinernema hermaphroditum TaxID=289476 RepID=A0AA39IT99_9BILA|nr:hypothetical protein QR680_011221 [Steinernema hermaphroditum]